MKIAFQRVLDIDQEPFKTFLVDVGKIVGGIRVDTNELSKFL